MLTVHTKGRSIGLYPRVLQVSENQHHDVFKSSIQRIEGDLYVEPLISEVTLS